MDSFNERIKAANSDDFGIDCSVELTQGSNTPCSSNKSIFLLNAGFWLV